MAERYQYGVLDTDDQLWLMPARMAEAVVAAVPGCTQWRRLVHVVLQQTGSQDVVSHGEWHPVEGGGR